MHDQADELRQLVRERFGAAARPAAPLVVVSGGKGGVGTTTIAANLAIALARQGRRSVFVDADLDHGGNTNLAGHAQRGSVLDVLAARRAVHDVLDRGPAGIHVLSGAWASGEVSDYSAAAQDRFIAELTHLAPHADVVVVDAGSSRGQFTRRFWKAASIVAVVTTCESAAVMSSYAGIKALGGCDVSAAIRTLVNLSDDAAEAADILARISTACRKFLAVGARAAGSVPRCTAEGNVEDVLVYPPRSEAARALDRVADTLWAELQIEAVGRREERSKDALEVSG
jgi:flagellar biosynthesis protein FlhG